MEVIHIVLGKANPERMNGVNKVVHEMAIQQKEYGLNVSVWGITADTTENFGTRPFRTRLFRKSTNPFGLPEKFAEALSVQPTDTVFHIHGGWVPVFSTVAAALRGAGFGYVFTPHGAYNTIAMQRNKWIKNIYFRLFEKSLLEGASKIHHIGQSETSGLGTIYTGNNIIELPYGYKTAGKTIEKNPSAGKFVIGFIGRLDIYTKGLDLLVSAFRKVAGKMPEAELWITGDSEERPRLEQMAGELFTAGKMVFTGSKFGAEKEEILASLDVFAHPSRNEGLPASVLEAAAAGIPCVVTKATNLGHQIAAANAGIAIADGNEVQLAEALTVLYDLWKKGELKNMGFNGTKMVIDMFSWESLLPKYEAMYANVLNHKKPSPKFAVIP